MKTVDELISKLFCPEFQKLIIKHINVCSTCQNGIVKLFDELPILGMITGLKNKVKGFSHGNSEESR
jgi:hypothetical protein